MPQQNLTPTEAFEKGLEAVNKARLEYQDKIESIESLKKENQAILTMLSQIIGDRQLLELELNNTKKLLDKESKKFVGSITPFATPTAPDGWLECNGQTVSRQKYSNLFEKIGTTFGAGDGETTFQLPDLRGQFIRGWDQTGQIDPDRPLGSFQSDQIQTHKHNDAGHSHGIDSHSHSLRIDPVGDHRHSGRAPNGSDRDGGSQGWVPEGKANSKSYKSTDRSGEHNVPENAMNFAGGHTHSGGIGDATPRIHANHANITEPTCASHGAETRPKNVALLYCIKY